MAILDRGFRQLASTLTGKFGTSVTVTYVTAGTYDPDTQAMTPTTSTASVNALVSSFALHEIQGTVEAGDVKVILPAKGVTEPKPDDRVTFNSVDYQIVNVTSMYSGDQVSAYQLQVRQ